MEVESRGWGGGAIAAETEASTTSCGGAAAPAMRKWRPRRALGNLLHAPDPVESHIAASCAGRVAEKGWRVKGVGEGLSADWLPNERGQALDGLH